jgi:WD40 repeat protein
MLANDMAASANNQKNYGLATRVQNHWSDVRSLAYGLWVARISVASVVCGGLLFYYARQAQDLFMEVGDTHGEGLKYWAFFYAAVLLGWVLPVYVSARWIFTKVKKGTSANENDPALKEWARHTVPSLLAAACFGALLIGQVMALGNALTIDDKTATQARRQAIKDQFEDLIKNACPDAQKVTASKNENVDAFFSALGCAPLSTAVSLSRYAVFEISRGGEAGDVGLGNLILILYASCAGFVFWVWIRAPLRRLRSRKWRIATMIIWWVIMVFSIPAALITSFFIYGFVEQELQQPYGIWHLALMPAVSFALGLITWWGLRPRPQGRASNVGYALMWASRSQGIFDEATATARLVNPIFASLALVSLGVIAALAFVIHPVDATSHVFMFRRALLIPFFLGMMVFPLTYLSYWSLRTRAPLLVCMFLLIGVIGELLPGAHNVRVLPTGVARPTFHESVERWAAANNCKLDAPTTCPAPIIMSAAGGASRSAYLVAGVIGELVDDAWPALARGHDGNVESAVFSRDGARLATASEDETARLWDGKSGQPIVVLNGHTDDVTGAFFSPDGSRVVTRSKDNTARLWDGNTGSLIAVLLGHSDDVVSTAYSPDSARIVTRSKGDKTARLWDGKNGQLIEILEGHVGAVQSTIFSPDGAQIVTIASNDPTARLWDAKSGRAIAPLAGHTGTVQSATFSPDGAQILTTATNDHTARLWHGKSGNLIAPLPGHTGAVRTGAFSPNGAQIVTSAANDNIARLWDAKSGDPIASLADHTGAVRSAVFSPDSVRILTASADKTARLSDRNGKPLGNALVGHTKGLWSARFNRNGSRILTTSEDHTVRLWSGDGEAMGPLEGGQGNIRGAFFNPDGDRILTWNYSPDTTARLWNATTGRLIGILDGHRRAVLTASFSSDGSRIVTRSSDGSARLWDGTTADPIKRPHQHRPLNDQLFAISGVSGGSVAAVTFYAALADSRLASGPPREGPVNRMAESPRPPCKPYHDPMWHRSGDKKTPPNPEQSWRDCLQLLLAGDFLSPVFVSLMSGDALEFHPRGRSQVLEEAWEFRYAAITKDRSQSRPEVKSKDAGLAQSMIALRRDVLNKEGKNWLPILLLNGTSVESGRRIIASDVEMSIVRNNVRRRIFQDAYDLHSDLFGVGTPDSTGTGSGTGRDVRLSTAATISARFPIISPHGNILRAKDGKVVDRVVDGGYYENFGATTALELAAALENEYKLKPLIILVNNEPSTPDLNCRKEELRAPDPGRSQWIAFTTMFAPLEALMGTRSSRGAHAAVQLCDAVKEERFAFITVGDRHGPNAKKELSMSWWLSKYVQRYLDEELTSPKNSTAFKRISDQR